MNKSRLRKDELDFRPRAAAQDKHDRTMHMKNYM